MSLKTFIVVVIAMFATIAGASAATFHYSGYGPGLTGGYNTFSYGQAGQGSYGATFSPYGAYGGWNNGNSGGSFRYAYDYDGNSANGRSGGFDSISVRTSDVRGSVVYGRGLDYQGGYYGSVTAGSRSVSPYMYYPPQTNSPWGTYPRGVQSYPGVYGGWNGYNTRW